MNMTTTEHIVCSFTNKELKTLIMALKRFNDQVGPYNQILMTKLVDGFFLSNDLESEMVKTPNRKNRMGVAEGKEYLANL
jgi:hypothetical protein